MNAELTDFLQSRRARLTPRDVDLPDHGRRRVPGLRREEVAQLANVSTDYYIRLEQGRGRHVSDAVLGAVSRALHLTPAEDTYLHNLARPQIPPPSRAGRDPQPLRRGLQQLLDNMHDTPAIIVDYRMVIRSANALGTALFGLTDDPRSRDRARKFFLDPASRDFFPDWASDAENIAAELRVRAGRHPDDPQLTALISELSDKSADFRTLWAHHVVRDKIQGIKRLNHPIVGELVFSYERLVLPGDDEHTLIAYTPEPGTPTADNLAMLASWTGTSTGRSAPSHSTVR